MRRPLSLFLILLTALILAVATPAMTSRAQNAACLEIDQETGQCKVRAGGGTVDLAGASTGRSKPPPPKCYFEGREIQCRTDDGYWHSELNCYMKPFDGNLPPSRVLYASGAEMPEQPAPGKVRMLCLHPHGGGWIFDITPGEAAPPPDPRTVAWQLIAAIDLRAGEVGLVPNSDHALVGMPTWMWVNDPGPQTTGPISRSTTTAGYTITIEARLAQVVYAMGDGTTVTCAGANAAGTRYTDSHGLQPSPTCGHRYQQPGSYTVTATSHWEVAWHGVGQAGTITLTLQRTLQTTVREGHSVNR